MCFIQMLQNLEHYKRFNLERYFHSQMLGQTYFDDEEITKVQEVKKKSNKTNKKAKKQKHENIMKALPPSCFSCSAHSDDFLRLHPDPISNRPTCKSCGFKLSGKLGYLICPKTVNCYVLCSSCKVCSSNHVLRKMYTLKHLTDNELYAKNKFKCHGCKEEKQVNETKGVHHCSVCAFTICPECIAKTEALWAEKNISQDEQQDE